ncbi:MAG: nucleotide-binding protein [Verrucomicrobiia bacterium]|jgi:predicted nucleotide-binding protein
MNSKELIETLVKDLTALPHRDNARLDALRRRTNMIVRKVFPESSDHLKEVTSIQFYPMVGYEGQPDSDYDDSWRSGRSSMMNLLNTFLEEIKLSEAIMVDSEPNAAGAKDSKRVFLVHGHDEEMKQAAARMLEQLGLAPVILHEQPNKGRTIIEKFTDYSDVGFAVVLLSPDDLGCSKDQRIETARLRARQNVVFELGFFIGKIGRSNVAALYREHANFEKPSDYDGVAYIAFDRVGRWRFDIAKELKACGYSVDANKLL